VLLGDSTAIAIGHASIVEACSPVWATADDSAVVVVLAVAFPPAFLADLVSAALVQCSMAAAWARFLLGVETKPPAATFEDLLVAHVRIVTRHPAYSQGDETTSAELQERAEFQ
jgi:hypothetical protein